MNAMLSKAVFENQTKHFSQRLLDVRGWQVNMMSYPILDMTFLLPNRRPFRVRMICGNYDDQASTIELLNGSGGYLGPHDVPLGDKSVINRGPHHITQRPFICSPGSHEYHIHMSHINDQWENYKGKSNYDLGGMLTQIHNAWIKTRDVA